jgi:hypothetical protein
MDTPHPQPHIVVHPGTRRTNRRRRIEAIIWWGAQTLA